MTTVGRVESPVFFFLGEDASSQPPNIIAEIKAEIQDSVTCHELKGFKEKTRAPSGDLLIQRVDSAGLAIVTEWYAPYVTRFGRDFSDLPYLITAISNSSQYLDGIFVNIPYIELRDDRRFRDAPPRADITTETLAEKDKKNRIVGFSLWDPHSALGVDLLRNNFAKRNREVKVYCFTALPLFAEEFQRKLDIENHREEYIIVSVDLGTLHRSMLLANQLKLPIALFDKSRPEVGDVVFGDLYVRDENSGLIKKVDPTVLKGKKAILVDDLYFTTKTAAEGAKSLKGIHDISEVHFAATHAAYIMPEAAQYLDEALQKGIIDSAYVTDTLPTCNLIPKVKVLSLAEPMALVMKVAGGLATPGEIAELDKYYYHPGPTKALLNELFKSGKLNLTSENWEWLHPPIKMPQWGLIYYYWRGRENP